MAAALFVILAAYLFGLSREAKPAQS
jgi:hypothetical protein